MIARFFLHPRLAHPFDGYDSDQREEITERVYTGWRVSLHAYGQIDNAEFELDDPGRQTSAGLTFSQSLNKLLSKELYIELWDYDSLTGQYVTRVRRLFGGQITEIKVRRKGIGRVFKCRALGWAYKLSNLIVNQRYTTSPFGAVTDQDLILGRTPPNTCLLYTSPSPRDRTRSRMPSSA